MYYRGMATTLITDANFRTVCAECADAIAASNFALAMQLYAKAEAINAAFERSVTDDAAQVIRRENLTGLRDAIDAAKNIIERRQDNRRFLRASFRIGR